MNFWHWLTKSTTRKALHVGNLKFSDGLQVPKNKSNTNWWNCCKKNTQVYILSFSPRCTWAWLRTPCGVWSHTLRSCSHTTRYFLTSAKTSHSPPDNFNKTFLKWAFDITCHYALITPPLSSQWPPITPHTLKIPQRPLLPGSGLSRRVGHHLPLSWGRTTL